MANYSRNKTFKRRLSLTRRLVRLMADAAADCPDAASLYQRAQGWHNLQGHSGKIVPLAVWFAFRHREVCEEIRQHTSLRTNMGARSDEARDPVWTTVQTRLRKDLRTDGNDVLSNSGRANSPRTARTIATTYLSNDYGGGQRRGGGGNTVLKRTLKLLSHTLA